ARGFGCVYKWNPLLIKASGLPVGIRTVIIPIQHLHFIQSLHKNAAIAPALTFTDDFRWCPPFHVELVIGKLLSGLDIALTSYHGEGTVRYRPFRGRRTVFPAYPLIQ